MNIDQALKKRRFDKVQEGIEKVFDRIIDDDPILKVKKNLIKELIAAMPTNSSPDSYFQKVEETIFGKLPESIDGEPPLKFKDFFQLPQSTEVCRRGFCILHMLRTTDWNIYDVFELGRGFGELVIISEQTERFFAFMEIAGMYGGFKRHSAKTTRVDAALALAEEQWKTGDARLHNKMVRYLIANGFKDLSHTYLLKKLRPLARKYGRLYDPAAMAPKVSPPKK